MRYVAAYLLAALGGNENPASSDIKKILESVGIEADDTRMEKVNTAFVLYSTAVTVCLHQLLITALIFTKLFSRSTGHL